MAGGIRSAQEGRASDRAAVVVVLATAVRDVKTAVEAIKRGAYDYITKPFDVDAIVLLVDRALEKRPSRGRCCACGRSLPSRSRRRDAGLIGGHPEMQRIYQVIRQVAGTPTAVLITGESGTGKASDRADAGRAVAGD